jgi:hypothetical protein
LLGTCDHTSPAIVTEIGSSRKSTATGIREGFPPRWPLQHVNLLEFRAHFGDDGLNQEQYCYADMTQNKDIRFCPFCSVMEFDMATVGDTVHCELCGVEVPVEDLAEIV